MANDGRIILVGRSGADARPPAEPPRPPVVTPQPPTVPVPAPARPSSPGDRESGWTVGRLGNGAALAFVATLVGGLIFQKNFQLFGDNNRQLLAIGFGLFIVGVVVLTLCLIGLAARAARSMVANLGLAAALGLALAPLVPLVLLKAIGLLPFAFPALFAIVVAGGFTLALKR
jgi:hypothetical protein